MKKGINIIKSHFLFATNKTYLNLLPSLSVDYLQFIWKIHWFLIVYIKEIYQRYFFRIFEHFIKEVDRGIR